LIDKQKKLNEEITDLENKKNTSLAERNIKVLEREAEIKRQLNKLENQ